MTEEQEVLRYLSQLITEKFFYNTFVYTSPPILEVQLPGKLPGVPPMQGHKYSVRVELEDGFAVAADSHKVPLSDPDFEYMFLVTISEIVLEVYGREEKDLIANLKQVTTQIQNVNLAVSELKSEHS